MNPHYLFVALRGGHRCEYCRAPEAAFNFTHEVEHVVPRALGGTDEESNLALACRSCNLFKSNFSTGKTGGAGETVRLFNPRADDWHAHFGFDADTFEIRGITAVGRATVERLQMNTRLQLNARRYWMAFGLFP